MNLFRLVPGYTDHVYEAGKEPLLLMLIAFLVAFLLTRAYTRIARVRGWGSTHVGDVHMHHVVVGILLMTAAGVIEFGFSPSEVFSEWLAIAFGVGAACVGAAGALVAPLLPFQPPTGLQLSVASFNIVIIGGMGSLLGAFVGGLLVAVAESLGAVFLRPSLKELVSFSLLVLILLFRPTGLFGRRAP